MLTDLLCSVAVASATYAIDKPYTYLVPVSLQDRTRAGMRVMVPFGQGNKRVEALILELKQGERHKGLKSVLALLDEAPLLTQEELRLAVWMRERYFCTVYDAFKTMLPTGLYHSLKDCYRIVSGIDREDAYASAQDEKENRVLELLFSLEGSMEKGALMEAFGVSDPRRAIKSLQEKGIIVLETAISRAVKDKTEQRVSLKIPSEEAMQQISARSHAQIAVIRFLNQVPLASVKDIRYFTGASAATIKSLERRGILNVEQCQVLPRSHVKQSPAAPEPILNAAQACCYDGIEALRQRQDFSCALLYGVTGSGKTSVYIRLIHNTLREGKSALVLVPEIALTPQLLAQFSAQFGARVAVLHSMLSPRDRYEEWKRVRSGDAQVVVGTRSAVFAPLQNLGLIILDEEQEASYKSETTPRYHAREVAKYRAYRSKALLLLGSATPSIESMWHAKNGDYTLFVLSQRYNCMSLPQVIISDMKKTLREGNDSIIGTELRQEIECNLERGEQSILFINRRGTSKMVFCAECGESPSCPRCSVRLTYHKANGRLMCHYCGHSQPMPQFCPECGGSLIFFGAGTQKVQEEIEAIFPGTEVMRMDTDTISASQSHEKMLEKFRVCNVPILVGTQMVAKGLDFENVTLVGVISADQSLYVEDYRATERTFSLLTQVVGRAGRGAQSGRAVIQTYTPQNDVICSAAMQDYDRFYEKESVLRATRGLPPYRDMYVFTISGVDESAVLHCCMRLKDGLLGWQKSPQLKESEMQILGPAAAPILMVNRRYRYRITVLAHGGVAIRKMIGHILKTAHSDPLNRAVSVFVDFNPME